MSSSRLLSDYLSQVFSIPAFLSLLLSGPVLSPSVLLNLFPVYQTLIYGREYHLFGECISVVCSKIYMKHDDPTHSECRLFENNKGIFLVAEWKHARRRFTTKKEKRKKKSPVSMLALTLTTFNHFFTTLISSFHSRLYRKIGQHKEQRLI